MAILNPISTIPRISNAVAGDVAVLNSDGTIADSGAGTISAAAISVIAGSVVAASLTGYAPLASPTFTGIIVIPSLTGGSVSMTGTIAAASLTSSGGLSIGGATTLASVATSSITSSSGFNLSDGTYSVASGSGSSYLYGLGLESTLSAGGINIGGSNITLDSGTGSGYFNSNLTIGGTLSAYAVSVLGTSSLSAYSLSISGATTLDRGGITTDGNGDLTVVGYINAGTLQQNGQSMLNPLPFDPYLNTDGSGNLDVNSLSVFGGGINASGTTTLDSGYITTDGSGNIDLNGGSVSEASWYAGGGGSFSVSYTTTLDSGAITTDGSGNMTIASISLNVNVVPLPVAGTIYFDGTHFQGFDGSTWKQLDN